MDIEKNQTLEEELVSLKEKINAIESRFSIRNENKDNYKSIDIEDSLIFSTKIKISKKIFPSLLFISIFTMVLMTIYEAAKQGLHSNLTLWQSHTITIIFSSLVAPVGAYFALKRIEIMRQKAIEEVKFRKIAEENLIKSHDKLEERVVKRTAELTKANELLQSEINLRKQAEEEIRKYAEEILFNKELLEKKTEELYELNDQLSKSEKDLKALNENKDRFFSILAHDLRSPFYSIKGLSEIIVSELDTMPIDELREVSNGIFQSSQSIYRLLENLLEWSQVQSNRIDFKPNNFLITELLEENLNLAKISAERKRISIKFQCFENLEVFADRNMIDSVVRNLISNSIKFTSEGGFISLSTELKETYVLVSITDNGVGIKKEILEKIFDSKEIFTSNGTNNEKGSGLGLVLCKEFVKKNSGSIWVESEFNKGTTFYFTIPVSFPIKE
ncbi:MAG: ATP-binding protein [Melioribacteraceae bacterium]|nr:ATP-binding protein [Melioribacteraceae bacterium]